MPRHLPYWRRRLAGAPPTLDLPADRPRPAAQSYRGQARNLYVPGPLSQRLWNLSRRWGGTLFMTMLAAYESLLARYTGRTDLVVGTGVANRRLQEIEGVVGMVINTLALRTDLGGDPPFLELLVRVRETCVGAYAHEDLPWEKVVEALEPERTLRHTPVIQQMFAFYDTPHPPIEMPGIEIEVVDAHNRSAKFDQLLIVTPGFQEDEEIEVHFEWTTDLFDATTSLRTWRHYLSILAAVAEEPRRRLSDLPLLGPAERWQLTGEWNDTAAPAPAHRFLQEPFEGWAAQAPEAVALVAGGAAVSYRELVRRAWRLAHHLASRGVGEGAMVGLCLPRSPEMVTAALAVLAAGAGYVPLDSAYPESRRAYMAADAGAAVVLTGDDLAAGVEPAGGPDGPPPRSPEPVGLAYVLYTSGSTGRPKGVMVGHREALSLLAWVHRTFAVGPGDRLLFTTSLSFDLSVYDLFGTLGAGATVRLASSEELREPARLVRMMVEEAITFWDSAPAALVQLVPFFPREGAGGRALRRVFLSGDWIPVGLPDQVRASFPAARVVALGGATEATIWSNFYPVGRVDPGWTSIPYGRPITRARYHVLDRRLTVCPTGVPGDLWIGGGCLAAGYARSPALTAGKLVPDPFGGEAGGRLYRTGDRARLLRDGNIEFLGRLDAQVKIRGYRIELGEIQVALGRHPGVREAVVLAREAPGGPDRPGERDLRLVAYVVPEEGAAPAAGELVEHLREHLPEFMLPAAVLFLDALPVTANGKLDRAALPAPEWGRREGAPAARPSGDPREELLAGLFAEVLGLDRVGVEESFFELGGHSLLATRLVSRLRESFGVEIPLRRLFEHPTAAGLARRVAAAQAAGEVPPPPLTADPRPESLPLAFAQERLWFLEQLTPGLTAYNVPAALRLVGRLALGALLRSLVSVARRHEALRTTFTQTGGEPRQVIHPRLDPRLALVDLAALPAPAAAAAARHLAAGEVRRPFDLARGPLARVVLARLGAEEHQAFLTLHHIVADGWSMGVFIREMRAAYGAFAAGEEPSLPELPVQYADYALWQRRWLTGGVLERQLEHWRRRLAGAPGFLELPADRPRPALRTPAAGIERLVVAGEPARRLQALARSSGATLFMVLLAAFQALLARVTGEEDLVVGTPVAGRGRREVEPLIGFFVNLLALRTDLSGDPPFSRLLARVRETALAAYAHQDLPFERLVDALAPARDLSRPPLFQVLLVLQNAADEALELPGLGLEPLPHTSGGAKLDLTWTVEEGAGGLEGGGGLAVAAEYSRDLFDATTVRRLLRWWRELLAVVAAEPERRLGELPLLGPAERQQVIREWNGGRRPARVSGTLHGRFQSWAARRPAAVALVFEGESWSYGGLAGRVRRLARRLAGRGVGPEMPVALALPRSSEQVVAMLAVLEAGGFYVPIDPGAPARRLALVLADCGARWLLAADGAAEPVSPEVELLDPLAEERAGDGREGPAATNGGLPLPAEALAYVIYTSGSTGRPKGVGVSHRNVLRLLDETAPRFGFGPDDTWTLFHSYAFDFSVWELWGALAFGGRLVGVPYWVSRQPEALWTLVTRERVTVLNQTPSAFAGLVRAVLHPLAEAPVNPSDGVPPDGSGVPGTSAVAGSDPTGVLGASLRAARELAPYGRADRRGPSSLRSPPAASSDASDRSCAAVPGPPAPSPTPFCAAELASDGGGESGVVPPAGSVTPGEGAEEGPSYAGQVVLSEGTEEGPPPPSQVVLSEGAGEGPREKGSGGRLAPGGQEAAPCTAVWSPATNPVRPTTGAATRVEDPKAAPSPGGAARPDPLSAPPGGGTPSARGGPGGSLSAPQGGGTPWGSSPARAGTEAGALRWVIFGGEALEVGPVGQWVEQFGDRRPGLVNMYGITETTVHVTFRRLTRQDLARGWSGRSPVGEAIPDLALHLLDRRGRPVPVGVVGEIFVGGPGLARGYLGRPGWTAARFLPDPFSGLPGERLYASGDLGRYRPDGELEHAGRADHQVKVRGVRIELGEVEAALARHPGVAQAVVSARPATDGSDGLDLRLVAYVAAAADGESPGEISPRDGLSEAELRRYLRERLPDAMVPGDFLLLDALPLTPSGKVNRRALPAPSAERPDLEAGYTAPRTPVERRLVALWEELLGREGVGIHDSFFDLGGHSLLANRLLFRIQETFGVRDLALRHLFEHPTVAELALEVTRRELETEDDGVVAQLLGELDGLSDSELADLLERETEATGGP